MPITYRGTATNSIAEHARGILPDLLPAGHGNLIDRLNRDIYYGPAHVQLSEWPRQEVECSYGDEGAYPFDFASALEELIEYLDQADNGPWYLYHDEEYWTQEKPAGHWMHEETGERNYEYDSYNNPGEDDEEGGLWEWCDPADYYRVEFTDLVREYIGQALFDLT